MNPKTIGGVIVGLIILILLFSSFFTVNQGETALTLRLGSIEKDAQGLPKIYGPGFAF